MSRKRLTWTRTAVTLAGTAGGETLIGADLDRYALVVFNRLGNNQIDVAIDGGTVTTNTGRSLLAGDEEGWMGDWCPDGIVKVFGSAGNIVNVWTAK